MERGIFTSRSTPAGGSKGGQEPRDIFGDDSRRKSMMLRALFEVRFARLQAMCNGWSKQLTPEDWRMRLLHKALFSTWVDLRSLVESPEIHS